MFWEGFNKKAVSKEWMKDMILRGSGGRMPHNAAFSMKAQDIMAEVKNLPNDTKNKDQIRKVLSNIKEIIKRRW